jgi:flagellar biogenesis protein FliO
MKIYAFITLCFLTLSFSSFAKITVKDLDLKTENGRGILTISYSGNLVDYPELNVNLNSVDVLIPNSRIQKSINRKVNFVTNNRHTRIKATQRRSNVTKVKTILPFTIDKVKDKVSLVIKDNKILLTFPKLKAESAYITTKPKVSNKVAETSPTSIRKASPVAKDLLNEDYLNSLIDQEKSFAANANSIKNIDKVKTTQSSQAANKAAPVDVKTAKKAPLSSGKSSFSFMTYAGKFVAFLGVVLLLFYGVITLMKKGVIKKGKLGFLNKTDQVTVLSQTFIAPKKSLMLIRAHNQVFLVSNTDAGIHAISEINDVSGLIKDGEKIIAGNNFDDSLGDADGDQKLVSKIKIKEDITQSNKQSSLSDFIGTKDRVKFSDQIKKKVKGLKPLQ